VWQDAKPPSSSSGGAAGKVDGLTEGTQTVAHIDPTPFEQVFSPQDLRRGRSLVAFAWATLGTFLLGCVLIVADMAVDLVANAGVLHVPRGAEKELTALVGDEVEADASVGHSEFAYSGRGILPQVWRERNRAWGPLLRWAYLRFPALRSDAPALVALVLVGSVLVLACSRCISRARTTCVRIALDRATRLRQRLHRQVLRLGPSDLQGDEHAQAMELFTTDVDTVRDGVFHYADRWLRDPFQLLLLGAMALVEAPVLALQCAIPLFACGFVVRRTFARLRDQQRLAAANSAKQLRLLAESLQKTRLIRGYGMESLGQAQFEKYLGRYEEETAAGLLARRASERWATALVCLTLAFVLFFLGGKVLFEPHAISFAEGVLLIAALGAAVPSLRRMAELRSDLTPAREAAVRIQAYLNKIPEVGQAIGARFLSPLAKQIEFSDVKYDGPNGPILDGLSLRIPAGRQAGLIATDPLEARAVAFMLPRFIEPRSGRVQFDGEDIAWVTLESLRAEAVFVGGRDPFITGTVAENIAAGDNRFSLQDVTEAAKLVHAHNFILKLPQGYETVIGEHGEQLDAGQAFRLGLARALVRKPALIVIEEPTDPLDDDTKKLVDDAYTRIAPGRTVVYLPGRLTTIRRCDELYLLHKGKLEVVGPRDRLVKSSPLYMHWEYLRFNEFRYEVDQAQGG
jgi:ABC-type multidrug transport system fused ATPase/permease subunit